MPKKPSTNNFDALGSIYDFIFKEADKPPDKRRPIRPTGVSGSSALTDAMFSALERPGAFASETVINEFNSALDVEIGRVSYGNFGSVKFTTTSLIDVLKDPEKAANKAIAREKATRSTQKAIFMGGALDDFIYSAWAQKYGNLEVKKALYGNSVAKDTQKAAERYKIQEALGQYAAAPRDRSALSRLQETPVMGRQSAVDTNFMASRSAELIATKVFEPRVWENMSDAEKGEFSDMLAQGKKIKDIKEYVVQKHASQGPRVMAQIGYRFDRVIAPTGLNENRGLNLFDPQTYRALETDNIRDRINKSKDPQEKAMYEKTLYLLNRDRNSLVNSINNIQTALKTTTDPDEKKKLKTELKDARSALRIVNGDSVIGRVGQIEGYMNSFNNVYGGVLGKNVVASVLDGSMYDPRKNSLFLPSSTTDVAGISDIVVPKKFDPLKKDVTHKTLGKYNEVLTDLNYFTPRSLFRTFLYNGEGFAYQLYKTGGRITEIEGFDLLNIKEEDLMRGITGSDIDTYLNNLISAGQGVLSPKALKQLEAYANRSKRLNRSVNNFSLVYKLQERFTKIFKDRNTKIRKGIADWVLRNSSMRAAFSKVGADALLRNWVARGGINTFVKSLVTGLASAAGISLGPVGAIVAGVVTSVVSEWAMKAVGVGINIVKWMLFGIVGILVLLFFVGSQAVSKFNQQTYSYRSEIPGNVIMCSAYEEVELKEGEKPWGDAIVPPPSGESCVIGSGSFGCSQGYIDVKGWSHQKIGHLMPVDITGVSYIYAPQFCDTGNCSISRIAKINCSDGSNAGGIVEMTAESGGTTYLFKFLHVKPLAGSGEKLSAGQPVAVVMDSPEIERGYCWTGKHLHLEAKQNGAVVDPLELLQSYSCGVPDESSCANP